MSKPRYNWWSFALAMIRDYPARARELRTIRTQKTTARISSMPGGGNASRGTEGVALRQLPPQEQREYDAVDGAIAMTRAMPEAEQRLKVVKLTLWRGCSVKGAAPIVNVAESTARRYRWQFVLLVGHKYGFLTREEYWAAIKKDFGN